MAKTYQAIQTVIVGAGGQAAIEFTNIPQIYDDLLIKLSLRCSRASVDTEAYIQFNNSTTGYSSRSLFGDGSTAGSANSAFYPMVLTNAANATASTFSNAEVYISNYRSSSNKSLLTDSVSETNASSVYQYLVAGLWSNSAAINSIRFTPATGSWVQHSTATLYGVGGARATGGTITADELYTYHTFTSTGAFVPLENIKNAEVLIIAGGGGGGTNQYHGGGGGAGGLINRSGLNFIAGTTISALVGAGATGWSNTGSNNYQGLDGSSSTFYNISATGGGGGGGFESPRQNGRPGGSGGGGGCTSGLVSVGGSGVFGQGFSGGGYGGAAGSPKVGGGGGGAGGAGTDGLIGSSGGNGGPGTSAYSSWGIVTGTGQNIAGVRWFAGGGGGSSESGYSPPGGNGGGGAGSVSNGTSGTANTGGGGGAGERSGTFSGGGGSGLIIIRYPNI